MKFIVASVLFAITATTAILSCSENISTENQNENSETTYPEYSIVSNDTFQIEESPLSQKDSIYLVADYKDNKMRYGYENKQGITIIKKQFDLAGEFYNDVAPVIKGSRNGLIDTSGEFIFEFKGYKLATFYNELGDITELMGNGEGYFMVTDGNEKYGYINSRNELIVPIEYDWGWAFSEGKALVEKNDKRGFVDITGKVVVPLQYLNARSYSEGLAAVMVKDKFAFIDHSGKMVIPSKYGSTRGFSEGLCAVSFENDYINMFFIDTLGKIIIAGPFEEAESFMNGEAVIQKRGKCRVIDKTGKELRKLNYDCFAKC